MTTHGLPDSQAMHQFHYINLDHNHEDMRQWLSHVVMQRREYSNELISVVSRGKDK